MEVAHKSESPVPPAPKLAIEKFADGAIACLKFAGMIDEGFEGKKLGASTGGDVLVIDLGGVKKISSFGIREWVDFITTASQQVRSVILIECAPKVVDQLNMVANFAGGGRVFSFYAPFRCDYCDSEHRVLLQVDRDHETIKAMKLAERPCPACKEAMYFDEDGATFFSYVLGQEKFELEPAVAGFLASKLDYAVSELNRKLRVDKVIEGRTTYVRLAGDLDGTFPRDKLADGLEGDVIVDLGSVGRIEPAGAAAWRGFVQVATPIVEHLYLANVPPAFLEKLAGKDDLGPKGEVLTLTLPYACATCGTTSAQHVAVAEHHDVLEFATAPELRCTTCKVRGRRDPDGAAARPAEADRERRARQVDRDLARARAGAGPQAADQARADHAAAHERGRTALAAARAVPRRAARDRRRGGGVSRLPAVRRRW